MRDDILVIPTLGGHYADEILSYTFSPTPNTLSQVAGNGIMHPLSKPLIERVLDDVELNHRRDHEDDVASVFSGEGLPGDMICWYLIEGEDDIFRLLCTVDLPVPQEKWGHALLLCNNYHRQCRFGRAYLRIREGQTDAKLSFDASLDLREGVTDSSLQRFIMLSLFAAHVFFEKTREQKLLVPARPPKRSKSTRTKEVSQHQ
jgi:hypothetical protein